VHLCPLCLSTLTDFYHRDKNRSYYQCNECELVFVPPEFRLDAQTEKAHYDHHENGLNDIGYRQFLSRLASPLLERLSPYSVGLEFGCGPGPALAEIFKEAGHRISLYDIYYYPDAAALHQTYDFVSATEVIEHLYYPDKVWTQWLSLIKPGGWLAIMTKQVTDLDGFINWHYKLDITHVVFFSRATFEFLAKRDNLALEFIGNDVIFLQKKL